MQYAPETQGILSLDQGWVRSRGKWGEEITREKLAEKGRVRKCASRCTSHASMNGTTRAHKLQRSAATAHRRCRYQRQHATHIAASIAN
jgi:hypothetical protein